MVNVFPYVDLKFALGSVAGFRDVYPGSDFFHPGCRVEEILDLDLQHRI
jgi:hypothetical protein